MRNALSRVRIRGVSFRRTGPQGTGAGHKKDPTHVRPRLQLSQQELAQGAPPPLTAPDLNRLLKDLGRQELHTLVSDCIDHVSRWRQIANAMDVQAGLAGDLAGPRRMRSNSRAVEGLLPLALGGEADPLTPDGNPTQILALEARAVFRLWRHRLEMLELVAGAQRSIQFEKKYENERKYEKRDGTHRSLNRSTDQSTDRSGTQFSGPGPRLQRR